MAADARAASSDVSITAQTNRECESTSNRQSVRCISARNTANTERLLDPNCMHPYMIHSHSPSPLHTCRSRYPLGRVSVRQCRNVVTQPDFPHNLVPESRVEAEIGPESVASTPSSAPRSAIRSPPCTTDNHPRKRDVSSERYHLRSVEGHGIPPCAYSVRDRHDFGKPIGQVEHDNHLLLPWSSRGAAPARPGRREGTAPGKMPFTQVTGAPSLSEVHSCGEPVTHRRAERDGRQERGHLCPQA